MYSKLDYFVTFRRWGSRFGYLGRKSERLLAVKHDYQARVQLKDIVDLFYGLHTVSISIAYAAILYGSAEVSWWIFSYVVRIR